MLLFNIQVNIGWINATPSVSKYTDGVLVSIYAYSGANTMYRKDALVDVGLLRQDRGTQDISIAWDHQEEEKLSIFYLLHYICFSIR